MQINFHATIITRRIVKNGSNESGEYFSPPLSFRRLTFLRRRRKAETAKNKTIARYNQEIVQSKKFTEKTGSFNVWRIRTASIG